MLYGEFISSKDDCCCGTGPIISWGGNVITVAVALVFLECMVCDGTKVKLGLGFGLWVKVVKVLLFSAC